MSAARVARLWVVGGVLLALVLTAATYLLVISPARSDVASTQTQVDDATLQQTLLRHRLRDLESAAKDTGALRSRVAAVEGSLPSAVDTQGLLRRVQTVATATGSGVENVTIGAATASAVEGVWALPVAISLTGTADALVEVLAQLQSDQSRLVTVAGSSLKQVEGGGYRLSLTATVYASSPPAATAGGTAVTGGAAGVGAAGTGAGATGAAAPAGGTTAS